MSFLLDKVQYIKVLLEEQPNISNAEIHSIYGATIDNLPGILLTHDGLIETARREINLSRARTRDTIYT